MTREADAPIALRLPDRSVAIASSAKPSDNPGISYRAAMHAVACFSLDCSSKQGGSP